MKTLLIALIASLSLACAATENTLPAKDPAPTTLEAAVAKREKGLKETYLLLENAAKKFEKDNNVAELAKSLKFYADIFKYDQNHYIVEMFAPIYRNQKIKNKLHEALSESLSLSDREEFIKRLKMSIREETEGNG